MAVDSLGHGSVPLGQERDKGKNVLKTSNDVFLVQFHTTHEDASTGYFLATIMSRSTYFKTIVLLKHVDGLSQQR